VGLLLEGNPNGSAEVAADGTFRIEHVLPQHYRLQVQPLPINGFIKTVRVNGTPIPDRSLDFTNGAEGAKLEITLSGNGGQVTGWVREDAAGTPSDDGTVLIFPDSEDTSGFDDWCDDLQCEAPFGVGGGYGFVRLRPGKYRLVVTPRTFSGMPAEIKDFIKQNRGRGEVIEIKEGDKISKNLRMPAED
jgi:hypothetical protein